MSFSKQRVLIFGGSGFVGQMCRVCAPEDAVIFSTYNIRPKSEQSGTEIQCDILNHARTRAVMEIAHPSAVIFLSKSPDFDANITAFLESLEYILEETKKRNARFLFLSTDAVFDGEKGRYTEDDPVCPGDAYGAGKAHAETLIRSRFPNTVIERTSYVYGRIGDMFDKRTTEMFSAVKEKKSIERFTDYFRSPTLVNDLASALWELIRSDFSGTIHIAGKRKSIFELSCDLARAFGYDGTLIHPSSIANASKKLAADTSLKPMPLIFPCSINLAMASL